MITTQKVDKVTQLISITICSMVGLSSNNLSTIKKLGANHVSIGFNNIRLIS
jgi:hypothetical protein